MSAPQMALLAGGMNMASSFMSALNTEQGYDIQVQENKYNAQQSRYAATQAFQESSLNSTMTALAGRRDIASGAAALSAAGNIGTSAQTAIREGAFNLDKDLAALRWRYGNEAIQHLNTAKMYDFNADVARMNRKNAKISMFLAPANAAANSLVSAYGYGMIGGK